MSPEFDPGASGASRDANESQLDQLARNPSARALLRQVIEQTRLSAGAVAASSASEQQALREVANRRRGEPFSLDPIAVELVLAFLRRQSPKPDLSPKILQTMAQTIAETLFEDPPSRARLEALWTHALEQ